MILRKTAMMILAMLFAIGCGDEGEILPTGTGEVLPLSDNTAPPNLQNWGELSSDWQGTPLAEKVLNSTFYMLRQISTNRYQRGGTAFLCGENRVATAYHVIKDAQKVWFYTLASPDVHYGPGTLLASSTDDDLAVFSISGNTGEPLELTDSDNVHIGDPIFVVSNPGSLRGTFSMGILSGMRDIANLGEFQFDAAVSPGSSGAPVVNPRGEVIAIVTGSYQITNGQNLNFAAPSNRLKELISTIR